MKRCVWSFVCAFVLLAGPVRADVWDTAGDTDDNTGSGQQHRFTAPIQVHDLGARPGPVADADFYSITAPSADVMGGDHRRDSRATLAMGVFRFNGWRPTVPRFWRAGSSC